MLLLLPLLLLPIVAIVTAADDDDAGPKDTGMTDLAPLGDRPVTVQPLTAPTNPAARLGEKLFQVHTRGSTWLAEIR